MRIKAILCIPPGDGKFPGVIIMHGGSGITISVETAAKQLASAGFATLLVNQSGTRQGFAPRLRISPMTHLADAFNALKFFAANPRVDSQRIGILGFSLGGISVLLSNSDFLRKSFLRNPLQFKAHAGIYPVCLFATHGPGSTTGAPLLLQVGGLDNSSPASACELVKRLHTQTQTQSSIELVRHADADHAWDNKYAGKPRYLAYQGNSTKCPAVSTSDKGELFIWRGDSLTPINYKAAESMLIDCLTFGATVGYSPDIARQSNELTLSFFRKQLN